MLSGVKFVPRDQIEGEKGKKSDGSERKKQKSGKKDRRNRRNSKYSSSDDEELEKVRKVSRKKKWYDSEESVSSSSGSGHSSDGEHQKDRHRKERKKKKKRYSDSSDCEDEDNKTNSKDGHNNKGASTNEVNIVRKEMGLEWMLRPAARPDHNTEAICNEKPEESLAEERQKTNPRELNPYFKDSGTGYPEEADLTKAKTDQDKLPSSSVVGDGGASWRLKALKRAKEQAAREGRSLDEVAEERWGSLGHLAVSVASSSAAPSRAHLHAIRSRKLGHNEDSNLDANNDKDIGKHTSRSYMKNVSVDRPKMRAPNVHDSLSWKKRKGQRLSDEDANLVASAVSSLNKFADDGNFLQKFAAKQSNVSSNSSTDTHVEKSVRGMKEETDLSKGETGGDKQTLSANQLAAKAMQLRMKGKHEEAEKLMKEVQAANAEKQTGENISRLKNQISTSRYVMQDMSRRQKEKEDNTDVLLAQQIAKSKSYSLSGRADDEYDYDGGPSSKRSRKKGAGDDKQLVTKQNLGRRIATQQERCHFCFENPVRPKHLVVAIANFTYLMLPQGQPVVPGLCCILTLQHESATRSVDDNVWEEIRNFKKCLIMMFGKQEKEMLFLETVMGLAQQRRHCMIECVPLPKEIAKQAPLYFKKAIDEAESEWSQHNAKKLIDTSQKGLRASIPKNFPYFHVEFGLSKGFVHVIDDETEFKSNLGQNVIRGMMQLPEEDMYRKQRYETVDAQKQAVAEFAKEWEPFDWTKQLE